MCSTLSDMSDRVDHRFDDEPSPGLWIREVQCGPLAGGLSGWAASPAGAVMAPRALSLHVVLPPGLAGRESWRCSRCLALTPVLVPGSPRRLRASRRRLPRRRL